MNVKKIKEGNEKKKMTMKRKEKKRKGIYRI